MRRGCYRRSLRRFRLFEVKKEVRDLPRDLTSNIHTSICLVNFPDRSSPYPTLVVNNLLVLPIHLECVAESIDIRGNTVASPSGGLTRTVASDYETSHMEQW